MSSSSSFGRNQRAHRRNPSVHALIRPWHAAGGAKTGYETIDEILRRRDEALVR